MTRPQSPLLSPLNNSQPAQSQAPHALASASAADSSYLVAQHAAPAQEAPAAHPAQAGSVAGPAHGEATHGAAAPGGEGHGAAPAGYLMPHELPNIATLIESAFNPAMRESHHGARPHPSEAFHIGPVPVLINPLFSIFSAILIVVVIRKAIRRASIERPGRFQVAIEAMLGGLRNFFVGIMGPKGEKYVPYLGSLWLFIWVNNLAGIIPGLKAPTSSFKTTIALGVCTFFYVQYNGIKESGPWGWFYHLLGSPKFDWKNDVIGSVFAIILMPLFLGLEIIGELVKPISLSLRLYGNIFGEDKLLASFLGMGMMITAAILGTPHPILGVPLSVIFYPLVVLTSTIQATVFSLLASIYITLLLPHEEHGHEHEPAHEAPTGPEVSQPGDAIAGAAQV